MKWELLTGRARIIAPPAIVWQWVAEPRAWSAWNPKIEEIVPISQDGPRHDWRFRIAYRLRRKKQLAEAELVTFKPNDRLVCRTSGGDLAAGGWLLETYALSEDEGTTLLTHTVDLANSRMPYFSRVAVVFLTWLFNSSGDLGHVRNLKALIEDGVPPPRREEANERGSSSPPTSA